ncbi:E3 ubiquitin-protein ligase [Acrasis kona]|uniref:E3 ubiquitin-protein ligase n=1 Tax=Acrasis kona TaxID=1008807 RepID=A0AAW2Z111_9EUKA
MKKVISSFTKQACCALELEGDFKNFITTGQATSARSSSDTKKVQENFLYHWRARVKGDRCGTEESRYLRIIREYPRLLNFYHHNHKQVIAAFGFNRDLVLDDFWKQNAMVENKELLPNNSKLTFDDKNTIIERPVGRPAGQQLVVIQQPPRNAPNGPPVNLLQLKGPPRR